MSDSHSSTEGNEKTVGSPTPRDSKRWSLFARKKEAQLSDEKEDLDDEKSHEEIKAPSVEDIRPVGFMDMFR